MKNKHIISMCYVKALLCLVLLCSIAVAGPLPASGATAKTGAKTTAKATPKTTAKSASRQSARKAPRPDAIKAAITMDMSRKRVLYQQNADRAIAPASLTKVLSMFVILDEVKAQRVSLDSVVTVSHKAAATGGSCMNLYAGEQVRLRELLRGMAIASGNDASVAAAQHVAGSEDRFVQMMNRKAKQIGMKNSVFKNVHGLPAKGQQTTARDMLALTTLYLQTHPQALEHYHSRRYLEFHGYTPNTNPLLGLLSGVDGLKTGYVGSSGYNLITTAKRGETRLVNVLLGAPNKAVRLQEATRMVQTGFESAEALAAQEAAAKSKGTKRSGKRKDAAPAAKKNTKTPSPAAKAQTQASFSRSRLN